MSPRLGLSLLVVTALGLILWFLTRPDPQGNALRARRVAARGLADGLTQKFAGQKVLVLSNPFVQTPGIASDIRAAEEAGLQGLREGCANKLTLSAVEFPALRPEAREDPRALVAQTETTTPLSYLVATNGFDLAFQKHTDVTLLASLIGLPADLDQCAIWKAPGPPRFALLWPDLRVVGDTTAVQQALTSGKLAAFVLRKPGGLPDSVPLGKDWRAEFAQRFLLVTPENAETILRDYPGLF
ncbi:MAG TPA: hypothetical protein VNU68_29485 [Verrucomicrobiae bacterium]|nr:hypothetical protein [Verrucomicrobiae bacterium]